MFWCHALKYQSSSDYGLMSCPQISILFRLWFDVMPSNINPLQTMVWCHALKYQSSSDYGLMSCPQISILFRLWFDVMPSNINSLQTMVWCHALKYQFSSDYGLMSCPFYPLNSSLIEDMTTWPRALLPNHPHFFPVHLCPGEWFPSHPSGTCIKVFQQKETWSAARVKCQAERGDLVMIENSDMNRFVWGTTFSSTHDRNKLLLIRTKQSKLINATDWGTLQFPDDGSRPAKTG